MQSHTAIHNCGENLPPSAVPSLVFSPYGTGKDEVRADWVGNPHWDILSRSQARTILSILGIDLPDWLLACHDRVPPVV
jgi:hypothetical protein